MEVWKRRYWTHKQNAGRRGKEFLLTFSEWMTIWTESGHMNERGRSIHQFVMARYGDVGPYAVGNVRIITGAENRAEQKCSLETRAKMGAARIGNKNSVGRVHTPERRAQISKSLAGNKSRTGMKDSPETRAKKSAALMGNTHTLGMRHSQEECERQRERSIKVWSNPELRDRQRQNRLGTTIPPETRAKMCIAARARVERKRRTDRRHRIFTYIRSDMAAPLQIKMAA